MKYGTDPEVFSAINLNGRDVAVSPAILEKFSGLKYLYQDKLQKHPVYIENNYYSWMQDGVAWELTLKNPLNSGKEMFEILNESTFILEEFLKNLDFQGKEIKLIKKPVIDLDKEMYLPYLNEKKIYQGFIFGCDPDQDAFEKEYSCKRIDAKEHNFRYGGCHLHFSGEKELSYEIPAIKLLAIFVGNYYISKSKFLNLDKIRGKIYGKACRYRKQSYPNGEKGIEYRTPSNSVLSFSEKEFENLFEMANIALDYLKNPKKGIEIIKNYLEDTVKAITMADKILSEEILNSILN